jgi:putative toxin-antitoxin system antitoxin component (TIGR02293 family)
MNILIVNRGWLAFSEQTGCLTSPHMRYIFASNELTIWNTLMSNLAAILQDLLGVKPKSTEPALALARSVQKGLPVSALDRVAGRVSPDDVRRFTYRVVPKPTLERRRRDKKPLTTDESDRLARIAKVFAFGIEVFGDETKVRSFLDRPHPMLDDAAPLEVALATGPGADMVINLLGRAAYSGGV